MVAGGPAKCWDSNGKSGRRTGPGDVESRIPPSVISKKMEAVDYNKDSSNGGLGKVLRELTQ